jgi:hypothetical protein
MEGTSSKEEATPVHIFALEGLVAINMNNTFSYQMRENAATSWANTRLGSVTEG